MICCLALYGGLVYEYDDDFIVSANDLISIGCGGVGSDRIDGRVYGSRLPLSETICAFMSVSSFLSSSTMRDEGDGDKG